MSLNDSRKVAIVTDSTADVPPELVQAYQITVVPAILTLDGESYVDDGRQITRSEFYQRLPSLSHPPTTASPSIATFEQAYDILLRQGAKQILSLHVASSLSSMLDVAKQAAKSFGERVLIFDSGQVSLGLGFQVIELASQAMQGASMRALTDLIGQMQPRVKLLALIDSLEYLKRSGRVHVITAHFGDLLRIKLLLEVAGGEVFRYGQSRTRGRGVAYLQAFAEKWAPFERLAVGHTAALEEAHAFADRLRHLCSHPLLVIDVTTVIGVHIGPGALGVLGLRA